jgi:hypothetical protein
MTEHGASVSVFRRAVQKAQEKPEVGGSAFRTHLACVFGECASSFSKDLLELLYDVWLLGVKIGEGTACEACGNIGDVQPEDSRTMYEWNGDGDNPNSPIRLCRDCAADHHANWDETWREYKASLLWR